MFVYLGVCSFGETIFGRFGMTDIVYLRAILLISSSSIEGDVVLKGRKEGVMLYFKNVSSTRRVSSSKYANFEKETTSQ